MVVASFGLLLPAHVIDAFRVGTLNMHPSLLPRHRGATPPGWHALVVALAHDRPRGDGRLPFGARRLEQKASAT